MITLAECPIVLLAEDDENDIFLISRAFKNFNNLARLIVVRDGEAVLDYLQGRGQYRDRRAWPLPRLVILDYWMPQLSGLDVLRQLRQDPQFSALPVVVLSGALTPAQAAAASEFRAVCCSKPCDSGAMLEELNQAICLALTLAWERVIRPGQAGKQVLLVDDDPIVLDSLRQLVTHVGHHVETAQSGLDALRKVESSDYDLVMTDLKMPCMTGAELAAEIKQRKPGLPIIFISGKLAPISGAEPTAFLAKPFSVDELRVAISTVTA